MFSACVRRHWFRSTQAHGFSPLSEDAGFHPCKGCTIFRPCPRAWVSFRAVADASTCVRRHWFRRPRDCRAGCSDRSRCTLDIRTEVRMPGRILWTLRSGRSRLPHPSPILPAEAGRVFLGRTGPSCDISIRRQMTPTFPTPKHGVRGLASEDARPISRYCRLGARRRPCNHTMHSPEGFSRRIAPRRTIYGSERSRCLPEGLRLVRDRPKTILRHRGRSPFGVRHVRRHDGTPHRISVIHGPETADDGSRTLRCVRSGQSEDRPQPQIPPKRSLGHIQKDIWQISRDLDPKQACVPEGTQIP